MKYLTILLVIALTGCASVPKKEQINVQCASLNIDMPTKPTLDFEDKGNAGDNLKEAYKNEYKLIVYSKDLEDILLKIKNANK